MKLFCSDIERTNVQFAHIIVILLEKGIMNSIGERREESEDVGKCSFEVRSEFFDGIEVRKVGR
jgi:hypothetical protein